MKFSFKTGGSEENVLKIGFFNGSIKDQFVYVFIALAICWLPLAVFTIIKGTFWTGSIETSFITHFDSQARFLIALPVLIFSEKIISQRLGIILGQFKSSGIIKKKDAAEFDGLIESKINFIRSNWTNIILIVVCYLHVVFVIFYESKTTTSILSWQMSEADGILSLNMAGRWSTLISRPILLFLFYRWFLWIFVWGRILKKISKLNLNLYPCHPDLCGGLGFIGYSIRYFSPIAFALTVTVTGVMTDFMLHEDMLFTDLKYYIIGIFLFVTLVFTLPLLSFSWKLSLAKEQGVFENNDFINGMFRELSEKVSKDFYQVNEQDLRSPEYSSAADLSALMDNALKMRYIPFTLRDLVPLWITTAIPFLIVVLLEVPLDQIIKELFTILV